ncbi:MAG: hypothetical protein ACREA9_11775 [Pyrinomonadaceae bacterium]
MSITTLMDAILPAYFVAIQLKRSFLKFVGHRASAWRRAGETPAVPAVARCACEGIFSHVIPGGALGSAGSRISD